MRFAKQTLVCAATATAMLGAAPPAAAWGPDGHHTVGALADRLLAGTRTADTVHALLRGLSLQDAAVWADCAKGVDPKKDFAYTSAGKYPECAVFETPEGEAEMIDFVRRNTDNCPRVPGDEACHAQYHYADEAIQRPRYTPGTTGTRDDDVVAAIAAATRVLQGQPAPAPFSIKDRREALLLVAHYAGDIHQPLHVGAVYLDPQGRRVDPDAAGFDPATATRGGNQVAAMLEATNHRIANLHQVWDDVPLAMTVAHVDGRWVAEARKVPRSRGDVSEWPMHWANETLVAAKGSFAHLDFGPELGGTWPTTVDCRYLAESTKTKHRQLTLAGAHLAQLLQAALADAAGG